ncbi:RHS repeat-associated core domain-containing protein [Actinomadura geliboluensis]|uniref:RHS repeat-associated core domain-containing protein n=1 Tax=Actinomadura geliboluensis TaxID=882440 RepID=UPI003722161A
MEDVVKAGRVKLRRRTLVLEPRRSARATAIVTAMALAAGLLSVPPALAEPPNSHRPKVEDHERVVDGRPLKARPRKTDTPKPGPAAKAAWPAPGTAEVKVPSGSDAGRTARAAGTAAKAGALPVEILAPAGSPTARTAPPAEQVRVQVLDRQAANTAGVDGLAFTVARTDAAAPGRVKLRLDYSAFAQAFGGAYGPRLRLMQMPACALTTPDQPQCRTPKPVATDNDGVRKTLTAEVEAAPAATSGSQAAAEADQSGTLLVAAAGSDSSQGDYKATSLEASATWQGGGSTGDFTWSYPMRVPPVPGGLTPNVTISYSSGSVDGRTANSNSQPSWVGEGFEMWPGYIERRYKSCEDDGAPKDEWGNSPGDQCWGYDNATVTWNGKGGELIKTSDGTWRAKSDDGTKYEKLTSSSVENGDDNGEYWKVTTTDGTQYFFGVNRAPGWVSGKPETGSTWTSPVFGDDAGEPCHGSSFATSWCQQAYRWNLDYVVDPNGNAILYTYGQETNHYGRNLKAADETPYVRGGYLKTISYGLRKDALFAKAPAQVTFATSERCIPTASFDCDPSKIADNPDQWWDVPWDLHCDSGQECKDTHGTLSPTFWSRKRLTQVTTQILKSDGSDYRPVDSWSMNHDWGLADVERDLLLEEIQHSGYAADGKKTTLPKVTFQAGQADNRLDEVGDDILAYVRYRVGTIWDESGGQIDITYSDPDCSLSDRPTPETNTTRCMPVIWTPPGREGPITDWFHKYVVTSVIQTDRTGLSPDMATKYEYLGGAAWHFDDDDGLTKDKKKTWSQWRGYGHVRTLTGSYNTPSAQSDTYYLRGMDGDRKTRDGGTKSVTVSDGEGGTYTDHDALAGFTLKTAQYTGPGGSIHSKTVNTPWRVQTASRTRPWGTTTANVTAIDDTRTWTVKDGGGWLQTKTDNSYASSGPGVGRVTSVSDLGDVDSNDDDRCTRTDYADNTGAWIVDSPSRVETVSVACSVSPDRSTQVVSDIRTFYDGLGFDEGPPVGNVTKVETIASHDGNSPTYVVEAQSTYDGYGRPTKVTNAANQTTTTSYTDTQGLNTQVTTTTPPAKPDVSSTALTTVKYLDPAWGVPVTTIDQSNMGLRTDYAYDPLGRLTKVWLPNQSKANGREPNYEYSYRVTEGQIVAVTTQTLTATGGQRLAGIELLDGWLRPRQVQVPGQTGRLISDTFYDNRGQVVKTYAAYAAEGAPATELFGIGTPGNIETQAHTEYDGLGRKTVEKLTSGNGSQPDSELWRTTYSYGGGNRVSVTPPSGGIANAQITDARGQVIERRQYKAATPTGEYDATRYTYTPAGEVATVTDPSGNTFTTSYDLRGRKIRTTDPDKGTSTFTYDDLDRLVSTTDARGKKIFVDYDGLSRKTATHDGAADGPLLASWTYDTAPFGKGKLATATRHTADGNYTSTVRHYDQLGRADKTALTIPASQGALAGQYQFSTQYGLDETILGQARPAAGGLPAESVTYQYDDLLRPTGMTGGTSPTDQTPYVNDALYTPTNKPNLLELGPDGKHTWQTFTYQYGTQRPATARTLHEGVQGDDRYATYHYTDAGTITSITDVSRDGVDNQCFTYDHLQRLTQAWTQSTTDACATQPSASLIGGPAPYWQSFTYDKAGNRTGETRHGIGGTTDTTRTYTYAPAGQGNRLNQVTQTGPTGQRSDTYTYDAVGNTTKRAIDAGPTNTGQTLEWNTEGELTKVTDNGNDLTFAYDADGNRLIRKDASGATLYLPDGTELRALNGATTATATRYYTFAGQTIAMRTSDGTITYLAADHQGTAQIAVNSTTQQTTVRRFTPFGSIRGMDDDATWPGDKGFVGGTQDPTGLTHLGAREYDPDTGRFISVDPLMDQADPQQMNGYTYANNSPVTNADPDGNMCRRTRDGLECFNGDGVDRRPNDKGGYDVYNPSGRRVARSGDSYGRDSRNARTVGSTDIIVVPKKVDVVRFRAKFWKLYFEEYGYSSFSPEMQASWELRIAYLVCGEMKDCSGNYTAWQVQLHLEWMGSQGGTFAFEGGPGNGLRKSPRVRVGGKPTAAGIRKNLANAACKGGNSFMPGTDVLMADGSRKKIEDIGVGDKVIATDPKTGKTTAEPVIATITGEGNKKLVQITVDTRVPALAWLAGKQPNRSVSPFQSPERSKSGMVIATNSHPFWVAGDINAWVKAADLKPGMWLRTSAGTYVQITATKHWISHNQRVYNLTIQDLHTYYVKVGSASVLTHNYDDDIDPRFRIPEWDPGDGDDDGNETTKDHERQNKQARDAIREAERKLGRRLNRAEKRKVHDAITKQGKGYHGVVDETMHLFGTCE